MAEWILIVEDDADMAEVLKTRLRSVGFEVHTEGQGKEALSYASEHQPDLVILDLKLPDMSGYEVCKGLRKLYDAWTPPVLMLTGMSEPVDKLRGFAYGADAYLTKPFEAAELIKAIALLLGDPHWDEHPLSRQPG